jgi:HD-GYP domain-containing protein (c-di-GMP phosphodiesterase class II)
MDRVQRAVSHIEVVNGSRVTLPTRISCGVVQFRGYETPRDLIAEAEEQMYLDKAGSASLSQTDGIEPPEPLRKITNLKALRNLVKAIDRRDSYTRFHSDHATQLALRVAKAIDLGEDQVSAITIGGPIHDLGKIVVPDEILRKPGPLTSFERKTMEEHPVMGAAITAAVTDYNTVVDLVRHHHERFDGAGYPAGLQGESITLTTRLFSIADAYSAMTTDRPYRKGLTAGQAMEQLVRGRGTQFDPDLAMEFLKVLEREHGRAAA